MYVCMYIYIYIYNKDTFFNSMIYVKIIFILNNLRTFCYLLFTNIYLVKFLR